MAQDSGALPHGSPEGAGVEAVLSTTAREMSVSRTGLHSRKDDSCAGGLPAGILGVRGSLPGLRWLVIFAWSSLLLTIAQNLKDQ